DPGLIADEDGRTALHLQHDVTDVVRAAQIAAAAHDILGFGHFDRAATDILVARTDCIADLAQRNAIGLQLLRVDDDLILLNEAADARDLGDAPGLGKLKTHGPILNGAQLGERALSAGHDIFID